MKIDRLLRFGIIIFAFLIVVAITTLLTLDMLRMSQKNAGVLEAVSTSVKEQNTAMYTSLNAQASKVGENIWNITNSAAEEQLKNIGDGIAEEIKGVMNMPFASAQALAKTLLFEKTEAERRGETPSREHIEQYLNNFLENSPEIEAIFCVWEKNKFDGKDAEFVDKENPDKEMEKTNLKYVSEGLFLPWYCRGVDEDTGKPKIIRAFCDDHLISDSNYYVTPRDTKLEFITEPYVDTQTPIASFCVPIILNDEVLGIAGIDIALEKLQKIVEERKPFGGFAMFFSPGGKIVYYPAPEINYIKKYNSENEKWEEDYRNIKEVKGLSETFEHIQKGKQETYISETLPGYEGTKMVLAPVTVTFGNYPGKWTVVVAAPVTGVMENRDQAKKDMDDMVVGIDAQNEAFGKQLDERLVTARSDTKKAETNSFRNSILFGAVVLVIAVFVGSYCAVWVNRSINARDFWYRQILDASTDPISVVDKNMNIVFLNKPALSLLGQSLDDCIGKGVAELWKPVLGEAYETCGLRVLLEDRKTLSRAEFNGAHWDVTSNHILEVHGERNGMVEIYKDVSDRENVFQLVHRVDELISSTVQQTTSIAQASADLSRGASQQADSVQSITGDMSTTNEQTRQNAERAIQANRLSEDAGQAAELGQTRMREMTTAMDQISDNARNMQVVIKTIDDIAFQTNLLALNAAVEAARAGAHGKGFAVVAEEVRNLAARSAKAAKETEDLIIKSNQQIAGGVSVADQTAEALNAISEHVTEVSGLIQQIAGSSQEQSVGVGRMTTTLQTVDRITQQNVELASTTADAVRLLSDEVRQLQDLMERLRT